MTNKAALKEALSSLYAAGQRALLALVGIVIGVGSVIAMISVGTMAQREAHRQFLEMGTDIITIQNSPAGVSLGSRPNFSRQISELLEIPAFCPAIAKVAPSVNPKIDVSYAGKKLDGAIVLGVNQAFQELQRLRTKTGRFLSDLDELERFCVVGDSLRAKIEQAGSKSIIGERIKAGGSIFTIVGTIEPAQKGLMRDFDANQAVYMHITTALRISGAAETATTIAQVKEKFDNAAAKEQVENYFQKNTKVKSFKVTSPEEMVAHMEKQMRLFTLLLGAVGSISLIMGGVGIMNVMISSVQERRKEIGIRRALGAKRKNIRDQFLLEALVLSLAGGALGIVFGTGASALMAHLAKWQFSLSFLSIISGVGVSTVIGVFFGLYPAHQASRLDPIVALRAE